ncbi:hypothetical protein Syun_025484 [Stephania yunnanensis]|uniref:Uncharacterized protein n=1 Tax=Stephania yunnanensis TaxID=152371 RepID=A0AAP0F0M9_9MAGN
MVYSYTTTYYSSLHDTITSLCKTMLPFSFKKRRFLALIAEQKKLSKQQSDNLKWQQESYHKILNLMGLHREGMVLELEVSAFRCYLLDTLVASPPEPEAPVVLRDKLLFLQELLYAKCISGEEYHSSKRPLLQRLAVQGAEIEVRDVIVAKRVGENSGEEEEEQWSEINFKDEECLMMSKDSLKLKNQLKNKPPMKRIKGAASVIGFMSPYKTSSTSKERKSTSEPKTAEPLRPLNVNIPCNINVSASFNENPFWVAAANEKQSEEQSIFMSASSPPSPFKAEKEKGSNEKVKKKGFSGLFLREQKEENGGHHKTDLEEPATTTKSSKKQWGFDGFKRLKQRDREEETAPLPLRERSDERNAPTTCHLVDSPIGEGPDTRLIKKKLHSDGSASDFFIDKVLGDNIKKELSRIQEELNTTNPNLQFSNDEMEAISTRLPVDKAELKKFFPRSWCDKYGDVVIDVVKKEFKDHVSEMESMRNANKEKRLSSARWVTFDDDNNGENYHLNQFVHPHQQPPFSTSTSSIANNHFFNDYTSKDENKLNPESESAFFHNPFWSPRTRS